ncbi:EpsI family protein [Aquabacterium lacunae]|uniref:EpsI family protein n=1 Tax=Aquabacterium lacunae TaxID=2528630 RepID=A0A4Q9GZA2_9BURK|nr:exosortase C-terminal domain/associated protein EpsI [Aquabacterium lacunae]TBO28316.1 EpsI family protein [Aquabacterium lacunae]
MKRRAFVITGTLAAASAVPLFLPHPKLLADELGDLKLEEAVPNEFGTWRRVSNQQPFILPDDQATLLKRIYTDNLSLTYENERSEVVMLTLAYGRKQTDSVSVHHPEVCYSAQGFSVTKVEYEELILEGKPLPVRKLTARLSERVEPITYWVTIGEMVASSKNQERIIRAKYKYTGFVPDGLLVRVSNIVSVQGRAADLIHLDFILGLYKVLPPRVRNRFFGIGR